MISRGPFPTIVSVVSHMWGVVLLFVAWEVYVKAAGFNAIVLPSPIDVLLSLYHDFERYLAPTWATLWVSIVGLLVGSICGGAFAILAWSSALASGLVSISALMIRSVPIVVFVPILATMMGYTTTMVISMVALMSFFPSFVMVSSGLTSLPKTADDVARVYGAGAGRKLWYMALPAALPNWLASLRLAASRAILATMVAEFLTGINGLGMLFLLARADLQSEIALGASLIAAGASMTLYFFFGRMERWVNERVS